MRYLNKYLFRISKYLFVALFLKVVRCEFQSPCPSVFQFRHDGENKLSGVIQVQNPNDNSKDIRLDVQMSVANRIEGFSGSIELINPLSQVIDDLLHNRPLQYTLQFPYWGQNSPKILHIMVNGKELCDGITIDNNLVAGVTTINFQHTLGDVSANGESRRTSGSIPSHPSGSPEPSYDFGTEPKNVKSQTDFNLQPPENSNHLYSSTTVPDKNSLSHHLQQNTTFHQNSSPLVPNSNYNNDYNNFNHTLNGEPGYQSWFKRTTSIPKPPVVNQAPLTQALKDSKLADNFSHNSKPFGAHNNTFNHSINDRPAFQSWFTRTSTSPEPPVNNQAPPTQVAKDSKLEEGFSHNSKPFGAHNNTFNHSFNDRPAFQSWFTRTSTSPEPPINNQAPPTQVAKDSKLEEGFSHNSKPLGAHNNTFNHSFNDRPGFQYLFIRTSTSPKPPVINQSPPTQVPKISKLEDDFLHNSKPFVDNNTFNHSFNDGSGFQNLFIGTSTSLEPSVIIQTPPTQVPIDSKFEDDFFYDSKPFVAHNTFNHSLNDKPGILTTTTTSSRPPLLQQVSSTQIPGDTEVDNLPTIANLVQKPFADVCGISINANELIVNGNKFDKGLYPWIAALFMQDSGNLKFICGTSLVSRKHVITAAHCVQFRRKKVKPENLWVVLGRENIQRWSNDGAQIIPGESTHICPDYKPLSGIADIAVIVLSEEAIFSALVRPICLWTEDSDVNRIVGKTGTTIGWGKDESGRPTTPEPREVVLPVVSGEDCLRSNSAFNVLTSNRTFCAGYRNDSGPCNGDSGSGFFMRVNERWILRGIVSISLVRPEHNCDLNQFVIFTDAAKYTDWLLSLLLQ